MQDFKWRPGQREVAEAVLEKLREGLIVGLDMPTGTGKTIVALHAAAKLVEEGLVSKAFIVVRTRSQLAAYLRDHRKLGLEPPGFLLNKALTCPLAGEGVSGEDIECKNCRIPVDPILAGEALSKAHDPYEAASTVSGQGYCPYRSMLEYAARSRITVATYPHLFNPWILESLVNAGVLEPQLSLIVVDEAHNLDKAVDFVSASITLKAVEAGLRELKRYAPGYQEVEKALEALAKWLQSLQGAGEGKLVKPPELSSEILEQVRDAADEVFYAKLQEKGVFTRTALKSITRFLALLSKGYPVFTTRNGVEAKPVDPAEVLGIINQARAALLMSGTMPPPEYVSKAWGLQRYHEVRSRDYGVEPPARQRWIIALDVSSKYTMRSPEMYDALARYVEHVYGRAERCVLCMAPSYTVLRELHERLAHLDPIVEEQDTRMTSVALEAEKRGWKLLILAVARGRLVEGVELVHQGESMLSAVVVAGLPYPDPSSDYYQMQAEAIEARSGLSRFQQARIQAWIAVRQAAGRLVRSPRDKGREVWILDYRAWRDPWWKARILSEDPRPRLVKLELLD